MATCAWNGRFDVQYCSAFCLEFRGLSPWTSLLASHVAETFFGGNFCLPADPSNNFTTCLLSADFFIPKICLMPRMLRIGLVQSGIAMRISDPNLTLAFHCPCRAVFEAWAASPGSVAQPLGKSRSAKFIHSLKYARYVLGRGGWMFDYFYKY